MYDVVLIEKPFGEGLSRIDVENMLSKLDSDNFLPFEAIGNSSSAMGFIAYSTAEKECFDLNILSLFIEDIIDDIDKETETGEYYLYNCKILIQR